MTITIKTSSYNERRYGKPYIARVTNWSGGNPDIIWGTWCGDHYNGTAGELEIEADAGDVIMEGQRDHRKMRNSAPNWYIVLVDGTLQRVDKPDARTAWRNKAAAANTTPDKISGVGIGA